MVKGAKSMKRRTAREKAIQTLYQVDLAKAEWKDALNSALEDEKSDTYLDDLITGISEHLEEVDAIFQPYLKNWTKDRLPHVDRAILRLAVYELKYSDDVPNQVIINEAIELAKKFGTEQSSKFINGVLSSVLKQGESIS
jgi:N utilization substance protein B